MIRNISSGVHLHFLSIPMKEKLKILSLNIDSISFKDLIDKVLHLGLSNTPSYVCFANVHMIIEAYRDTAFLRQVNNATLVAADGQPVAAASKWLHGKKQERIAGPDFLPQILHEADNISGNVYLYGSTNETLDALKKIIHQKYPSVNVVGAFSPPFRQLTEEEQQKYIDDINASGAHFVMVSLGCPKQEKWMADHSHKINAVLLGIGGAFRITAGLQKRSAKWMQTWGLEWLHRLFQEPARLFKRYFRTNTHFIWLLGKEMSKKIFV